MLAQKLFTLSLALVAALGLAEVATRVFVPDPHYYFENHRELFQEDDRMGYRNAPNVDFYAQGTVHVSTDSLGLREYDTRVNKPDGAIRILGLGDSITWGTGIEKEDTYLHLLGLSLNTLGHEESSTFETINAGVIGYSLHQELLLLEHLGVRLKPDVVLVGFAANDAYPTEDPFFNVQRFHQPSKKDVRRRGYSSVPEVDFYFFRFIRTKLRQVRDRLRYREQGPREPANRDTWAPGTFEASAWQPYLQTHFRDLKRLSDSQGFRLGVIVFPTVGQLSLMNKSSLPQVSLAEFFESEEIPYLDLYDVLRGNEETAFLDSMHLSESGHEIVAEQLVAFVSSHLD